MSEGLIITPQPIRANIGQPGGKTTGRAQSSTTEFAQVLDDHLQNTDIQFSKHAISRMQSRGIHFNAAEISRLEDAVSRAGDKGARDSLVLLDNAALVVSIRNNTVVTVVDGANLQENVFTNIDSAIIA